MASLKEQVSELGTALVKAQAKLAGVAHPAIHTPFSRRAPILAPRRQTLFGGGSTAALAKFQPLATLGTGNSLFKGFPEYNDDQPRAEDGTWTADGATTPGAGKDLLGVKPADRPSRWRKLGIGLAVVAGGLVLTLRVRNALLYQPLKQLAGVTPKGRTIQLYSDGRAPRAVQGIYAAVDAMPKAHYEALRQSGLRFIAVEDVRKVASPRILGGVIAAYQPSTHMLVVPQNTLKRNLLVEIFTGGKRVYLQVPSSDKLLKAAALHEMAHALDFSGGMFARHSKKLHSIMMGELGSRFPSWRRGYFENKIPLEIFAQVYSAKYANDSFMARAFWAPYFSRATQMDVAATFPKTMAALDKLENLTPSTVNTAATAAIGNFWTAVGVLGVRGVPYRPLFRSNFKRASLEKGHPEYDPNQPRDEDGQFASGGSGLSTPSPGVTVSPDAPKRRWPWKTIITGILLTAAGWKLYVRHRARATGLLGEAVVQLPVKYASVRTPLGRKVTLFSDAANPNAKKAILDAVDLIPKKHYDALRKSGLRFVTIKDMRAFKQPQSTSTVLGFYHPQAHALVVPETVVLAAGTRLASNASMAVTQRGIVLHEMAHALDWGGGKAVRLSASKLSATMASEFGVFAKSDVGKAKLTGWFKFYSPASHAREVFAEVYTAKYMPVGTGVYFGGNVTYAQMAEAFPKSLASMGQLTNVTPNVFSRFRNVYDTNLTYTIMSSFGHGTIPGLPPRPYFPRFKRAASFDVVKGYPEYDPNQDRAEDGTWAEGGGGAKTQWEASPTDPGVQVKDTAPKRPWPWTTIVIGAVTIGAIGYVVVQSKGQIIVQGTNVVKTTTPGGRQVTLLAQTGTPNAQKAILSAIDLMPEAHYAALQRSGMRFIASRNMGFIEASFPPTSVVGGFYHPSSHALVVPEIIRVAGTGVVIPQTMARMMQATLHEIGHALDFGKHFTANALGVVSTGVSATPAFQAIMMAEMRALAATKDAPHYIGRWYSSYPPQAFPQEIFAQVYSARYMPRSAKGDDLFYFTNMTQAMMFKAFPRTMAELDKLDTFKPGVFSRVA